MSSSFFRGPTTPKLLHFALVILLLSISLALASCGSISPSQQQAIQSQASFEQLLQQAKLAGVPHKSINHSGHVYVMGEIHTNTVESAFSLLKRGIVGTWHRISPKHLAAYLEEMEFRFNRRKRADLFIDTLRHMVTAPVLTFEKLTA